MRILKRFRKFGAIGSNNAKTLADLDMENFPFTSAGAKRVFEILQRRGIIQNDGTSTIYQNKHKTFVVDVRKGKGSAPPLPFSGGDGPSLPCLPPDGGGAALGSDGGSVYRGV